jgi:hypothetical protein
VSPRESAEARAERITLELRAATSEAAGAVKDLALVLASARKMVDEYAAREIERVMNLHLVKCQESVDQWYRDMVKNVDAVRARVDEAEANLGAQLDRTFEIPLEQAHKFQALLETMPRIEVHTKVLRD